ncbi:MAG: sugar-binding domain-containing protein [Victivallales bacterium]|nr:sugar-binding domain-containing protein [Victivallales bacterium]
MKKPAYSDDFLTAAARICYIDGTPQQQAARMLNVSQAKISRLLSLARQRGIVRISVDEYEPRCPELERELRQRFKLTEAIVIKALSGAGQATRVREVGYFGGRLLAPAITPGCTLGLAGGRTIMHVIDGLLTVGQPELEAVQLMGNVMSNPAPSDASEIGRKLVSGRGRFVALNAPVFVDDRNLQQSLLKHEQIRSVFRRFAALDMALVGVGIPENSIFAAYKAVSEKDIRELYAAGVVGEICGRFFDKDGREYAGKFRDRVISIDFEQLRRIPKVFAVVSDSDRKAAMLGDIRGNLINAVLIGQNTAESLLE